MKTFLSIVSIKTNNFSDEKIVVGLIAMASSKIHFAYSKNKLKLLNKLVSHTDLNSFTNSLLIQIKNTVDSKNVELLKNQHAILINTNTFSEEYFTYLNNYSNGVLHFSKPATLPFDFGDKDFDKYYNNFIGEKIVKDKPKTHKTFISKIKPYLEKEGLNEKADIQYILEPSIFTGIFKSVQMPIISKNGSINALQTIDFGFTTNVITNHLYETKAVSDALNLFSKKISCDVDKIKVVFEEPKLETEHHKLLDMAIKEYNNIFDFITPDEVDIYTDQIIDSNNVKFSSLI